MTVVELCVCGFPWPHPNNEPEPPVCTVCGRPWTREEGSEGSAFTLRCMHENDETCWHPGQVCEYWYSPRAHMVCGFGRTRRPRPADHVFVPRKYLEFMCDVCYGNPESPSHALPVAQQGEAP